VKSAVKVEGWPAAMRNATLGVSPGVCDSWCIARCCGTFIISPGVAAPSLLPLRSMRASISLNERNQRRERERESERERERERARAREGERERE
jgi:hypothetical protein